MTTSSRSTTQRGTTRPMVLRGTLVPPRDEKPLPKARVYGAGLEQSALRGPKTVAYQTLMDAVDQDPGAVPCITRTELDWFTEDPAEQREAAAACHDCPALTECGAYRLAHRQYWGVWGGMAPKKQRKDVKLPRLTEADEAADSRDVAAPSAAERVQGRMETPNDSPKPAKRHTGPQPAPKEHHEQDHDPQPRPAATPATVARQHETRRANTHGSNSRPAKRHAAAR